MALTKEQKERLDKLDFAQGGGFTDFMTGRDKVEPSGSKFLFIGLGGKGSQTVAAIKTEVYKTIKCPEGKTKPDNFEYLIVDTDKEEIRKLTQPGYGQIGLSSSPTDLETCQLYDQNAAAILKVKKEQIPENITRWINPLINADLQGAGAGGIRQAGRYLLFGNAAFNSLRQTLKVKLERLNGQIKNSQEEKLIVYVFAGVGGGSGSGTVIDIPYIVRKICEDNGWAVKIHGYIFLPDTYPDSAASSSHVKYNSYAALKEIDTLMNLGYMGDTARFRATYVPDFVVDSRESIFASCVLVSGKRSNGGMVINPPQFTKKVVVDNIISQVSDCRIQNGFLANQFLDNQLTQVANQVTQLQNNIPRNARFQYLVIGTGAVVLPMEEILAYLAHGALIEIEKAWDNHGQAQEVTSFMERCHLHPQNIADLIISKSKVAVMSYQKKMFGSSSKNDVLSGQLYNEIKSMWMVRNVELYKAWNESKNECLSLIGLKIRESYNSMFTSADQGIYYLKEFFNSCVETGGSFNGVKYRIQTEVLQTLEGLIGGQETIKLQLEMQKQGIVKKLESVGGLLFQGKLIEEYEELCVNQLVCDNLLDLYERVRDCIYQFAEYFNTKIEELQEYIDIFAYLRDIVESNYQNVMTGSLTQAEYAGRILDFSNKTDAELVCKELDKLLKQTTSKGLAANLAAMILKEENRWVNSTEEFEPMKVFVQFLEQEFAEIPNLTLEKFIVLKYGVDNLSTGIEKLCEELRSRAEVIFPTIPLLPLGDLASNCYVVIPTKAQNFGNEVVAYAKRHKAEIAYSSDPNHIYWYNLIEGVPLFANRDIADYEKIYESNDIAGMNLCESVKENWKDFPALTVQEIWTEPNFNLRERKLAQEVESNTEKFLESGLIQKQQGTGQYIAYYLSENDVEAEPKKILEWCRESYMEQPILTKEQQIDSGVDFFNRMKQSFPFGAGIVEIANVYMKNLNDKNLHKMLRLNVFLYKHLKNTYELLLQCREIIEAENAKREGLRREKRNIARFYDYVRTGIIRLGEESVFLENREGEQEELLYFDNYTMLDNQFYVYWAFMKMQEKCSEEELAELDEYWEELSANHSEEAREKYQKFSDELMENCTECRESLKKLDMKKKLKEAGNEEFLTVYAEFYEALLRMRKGK